MVCSDKWTWPPARSPEGRGSSGFVPVWHEALTQCASSENRSGRCPKLEPLLERPCRASSHGQE